MCGYREIDQERSGAEIYGELGYWVFIIYMVIRGQAFETNRDQFEITVVSARSECETFEFIILAGRHTVVLAI